MLKYKCISMTSLNKKKYKVILEGMETVTLSLYPSELRRYKIAEGLYLSEAVYEELMDTLYKRGKERALYYLKTSDKTEYQMRKKLIEGYYPANVIDKVLEFLTRYGYIDDVRYSENYISYNRKKKSVVNIKNDLLVKGVSKEVIDSVFCEFSEHIAIDEENAIRQYCQKKIKVDMDEKAYERLMISLLRKGFKYDLIKSIVRELREEHDYDV